MCPTLRVKCASHQPYVWTQVTDLPTAIRAIRAKRTQAQFAKVLGVSRETVSYWETGAATPSLAHLQRLRIVGLSPEFLLGSVEDNAAAVGDCYQEVAR